VTADLRAAAPDVRAAAKGTRTIVEALPEDLSNLLDFVRDAALATAGHDGISHYLRIFSLGSSKALGPSQPPPAPGEGGASLAPLAPLPLPSTGLLPVPSLPGLVPPLVDQVLTTPLLPNPDLGSATGLTERQERSLLGYLLGAG
jgi:hypothetical protein